MPAVATLLVVGLLAIAPHSLGQPVEPPRSTLAAGDNTKPTTEEKRCKASRRRVERQQEVITEANARIERETAARKACKTKRACDSLDRALNAGQTRSQRHAKQLAQFEAEAAKACAGVGTPPDG